MSDENRDPSGDTQAFRAFQQNAEPEAPRAGRFPPAMIIAGVVALVAVVVLVLVLLGG